MEEGEKGHLLQAEITVGLPLATCQRKIRIRRTGRCRIERREV
jgi:hypothetical protein